MGIQRVYRRTTPYPGIALATMDHAQTADVMFTAHIQYPPQKLVRYGHTDWRWFETTFGPELSPPSGATVTVTKPNSTGQKLRTYDYVITRISDNYPPQESRPSTFFSSGLNDMTLNGNYNTINLPPLSGATRHVVYKRQAGTFGYIGATDEATFKDENLLPILSETPPVAENPFSADGNYPSSVALHQQRAAYAGTRNIINGIFMSRTANYTNFDRARPVREDDALQFALVSEQVNAVTHLISMGDLMAFTGDGVWSITGGESGAITASNIIPKRETGRGASRVKPVPVDNVLFYMTARGRSMRALGFSFDIEGYKSDNVSIFAPHLLKQYNIVKLVYQEEPFACIWGVRADGILLCFTWEQEQEVWGWSVCKTEGLVEDVAVIAEGGNHRLYALIRRTLGGVERLFLERMALPHANDLYYACHLDCAKTQVYDVARNQIGELWHLEGRTVSVTYSAASGELWAAHGLVVTNGTINLPNGFEATIATVGLRYSGVLETLPAPLMTQSGSAHVNRQQIKDVVVRTIDTKGIEVGAKGTQLEQVEPEFGESVALTPDLSAVDYPVNIEGDWKDTSSIIVEQNEPFPAHIVGLFGDMLVSDQ